LAKTLIIVVSVMVSVIVAVSVVNLSIEREGVGQGLRLSELIFPKSEGSSQQRKENKLDKYR
jgi:hypothetical protein